VIEQGGQISEVMQAFRAFLGDSDMMAYLAMMAPRLVELHRVLKPTGSIYLHCDPFGEPLSEHSHGWRLRPAKLQERDYLEADNFS
jgi:hypothetical protein